MIIIRPLSVTKGGTFDKFSADTRASSATSTGDERKRLTRRELVGTGSRVTEVSVALPTRLRAAGIFVQQRMTIDSQSSPPAKRRGAGGASHAPAEDGAPASPAEDADGGAPAAGATVEQATCPRCAWSFPVDGAQARASEREAHEERMTGWWWKHQRLTFPMCRTEVLYGLICPCIWPYMSL